MNSPTRFSRPFFVTPHAVDQFREKITKLPAATVISAVQRALQAADLVDLPVYRGYIGGQVFYAVVAPPTDAEEWEAVVTILGKESHIHNKLMKQRRLQ